MKLMFTLLISLSFTIIHAQTINLKIENIENNKGQFQIAIFDSHESFDKEKAIKVFTFSKSKVKDGKMNVSFQLEPGEYGFTVLDDEDKNNTMTYRFGIYPLEGVGFSDYKLTGMSKPDFEDFKFKLENSDKSITAVMRYF